MSLQPLDHLFRNALVDDIERCQHVGLQPGNERLEESVSLVLVDLPRTGAGRRSHFPSASVKAQGVLERLVHVGQLEEHFIGKLLVLEVRWLERLEEIQVKSRGGWAVDRSLGAPKKRYPRRVILCSRHSISCSQIW